jgi:hypothetical protein
MRSITVATAVTLAVMTTTPAVPRRGSLRKSDLTLGVLLVALLACAACTGEEPADTPPSAAHEGDLRLGGEAGTLCVAAGATPDYLVGFDAVTNSTAADIQVNQVRLIGASGATLVGSYLAPIRNRTLLGAIPGWPPAETDLIAFNAKKAVPAPVSAHDAVNLLVHVQAIVPAKIAAVEVTYTSDGKKWRVQSTTALEIEKVCA